MPQAQATQGDCEIYRPLVEKYSWDANIALAVMQAESTCRADAVGDNYPIAGLLAPSCGLMQIRTLQGRPSCEELKNPEVNIQWAYRLYTERGFTPWSVYTNGKYLNYL